MLTHSSILAWRIPWTEEPGGLQSMGSQRVRHDRTTNIHTYCPRKFLHLLDKYFLSIKCVSGTAPNTRKMLNPRDPVALGRSAVREGDRYEKVGPD